MASTPSRPPSTSGLNSTANKKSLLNSLTPLSSDPPPSTAWTTTSSELGTSKETSFTTTILSLMTAPPRDNLFWSTMSHSASSMPSNCPRLQEKPTKLVLFFFSYFFFIIIIIIIKNIWIYIFNKLCYFLLVKQTRHSFTKLIVNLIKLSYIYIIFIYKML